MKHINAYIIAAILLLAGVAHLAFPAAFAPIMPPYLPLLPVNYAIGLIELGMGYLLLRPKSRALGGQLFLLLMVIYLPLHVWDVWRDEPAMGSFEGAIIRLILQFALIYMGWDVWKNKR